ncbi:positive transcription elongation factor [Trichosporon asahii var. asahii CBS 2479]|uniref:Positive transcription elongation factor n=1 Tax=Trichosporon asahii var. asahii (strain ATCC 90039 / CBS 2479 / JCM 2466 / KCTC 7840 / NBRC 103889/ NCYC 2677 / UAMH 7654) TaxID=1186058 RepID=J6F3P9_TRIAS|nr:positive transcription elongation factor [Trichosporon asahii var. asahii CBS 2479]EJT51614.1 positive transcription elongation factor [Trichosporon asahii var. asahii CBS 2479]
MPMDATALTASVKELNEASAGGKTEASEEAQGRCRAHRGAAESIAVGKLRQNATPGVSSLAKEIVKQWKEAVEESKRKRKREAEADGSAPKDDAVKRVKATSAAPSSGAASPAASTPAGSAGDPRSPKSPAPLTTIDSTRTTPRNSKTDDMVSRLRSDSTDAASEDLTSDKKTIAERAIGIEREAFKLLKFNSGNEYRAKMRSLFLNIKDKGNPGLRNEIVLGQVTPDKVVRMSKEEMASESVRLLNEKLAEKNLFKAKAVGVTQAETDAFKCSRCQQRKCTYYQMQTRSADEPMTCGGC